MAFTIPKELVNRLTKKFDYEQAQAAVKTLTNDGNCEEEVNDAYQVLLAAHPGRNGNSSHAETGSENGLYGQTNETPGKAADWQAITPITASPVDELKAKFEAGEIDIDEYTEQVRSAKEGLELAFNPAKGTVALRGLRRFTVAYYPTEWRTILANGAAILAYLDEHAEELKAAEKASGK